MGSLGLVLIGANGVLPLTGCHRFEARTSWQPFCRNGAVQTVIYASMLVQQPQTHPMRTCIAVVAVCGLTILLQPDLTTLLTWL